jgi:hypothetical protein
MGDSSEKSKKVKTCSRSRSQNDDIDELAYEPSTAMPLMRDLKNYKFNDNYNKVMADSPKITPKQYDALLDRNGRVVPNRCSGKELRMEDSTGITYRGLGYTDGYGNIDTLVPKKNLVVRYKCLNDMKSPVMSLNMKEDQNEVMTCEGFTVLSGQIYKSLPPCRKCGGSCPWHWDMVTQRKGTTVTTQAFYTIDGQFVTYDL